MHVYLEPVGGIAGDMFSAALLDAFPDLIEPLLAALADAGLSDLVRVECVPFDDHTLTGSRLVVTAATPAAHHHRSYSAIVTLLDSSPLSAAVTGHALGLFRLLAEAEAKVHGCAVEAVAFHEVGAWDSIADIVAAAWLIDQLGSVSWYCGPLPMGRGLVKTAHGLLPIPAPATANLLAGFPVYQDNLDGERITPTGAAILRYLNPEFGPLVGVLILQTTGIGFGARRLPGISNILRVAVLVDSAASDQVQSGTIEICEFEIDDQTAEDLAIGLDRLREHPQVLDVHQSVVYGKKGRLMTHIRLLASCGARASISTACFAETSTLGLRWQRVERLTLDRDETHHHGIRVKRAYRPDGLSAKAENDDLATAGGDRQAREIARRAAETAAIEERNDRADGAS